jgi:lysozyme
MVDLNRARLDDQLILHEGLRLLPYDDATGKTVKPGQHYRGKLTTGIGRNLDGNPLTNAEVAHIGHNGREKAITKEQALYLLHNDIASVCRALDANLPWWQSLDEVRARALVDMCFNMGITKLLTFRNTLSFIRTGSYNAAATNLEKSLWYKQVGDGNPADGEINDRSERIVYMIHTGKDWLA